MSDESNQTGENFAKELPNQPARDSKGKFVETTMLEDVFAPRRFEGEDDGGEDPGLVRREREIADGRTDKGDGRRTAEDAKDLRRAPADAEDLLADYDEQADLPTTDGGQEGETEEQPDQGPKYEIVVEGEHREVTLQEALQGYVRQETFAKYVQQLQAFKTQLEASQQQLAQNWAMWDKAKAEFEEDVLGMLPPEPNWDEEFLRDPAAAHNKQKIYIALHTRLAKSRADRAQRQQQEAQERDRQVEKYAVDGFAKFVADNKIPEDKLQRELLSMRRTAAAAGFSEYEVATVYDPRMLTVLRKASIYDRIQANRPKAVIPGKGRTLPPGSAPPIGADRGRKSLDEAQRQLARSGRLDDAAKVFERILS